MRAFMLCVQLGCVIPYGEPWKMVHSEPVPVPELERFADVDAHLVRALQVEQDRFTRAHLMLARELLVEAKLMSPKAQQQVLDYLSAMASMVENSRVSPAEWSTVGDETDLRLESVEQRQIIPNFETQQTEER